MILIVDFKGTIIGSRVAESCKASADNDQIVKCGWDGTIIPRDSMFGFWAIDRPDVDEFYEVHYTDDLGMDVVSFVSKDQIISVDVNNRLERTWNLHGLHSIEAPPDVKKERGWE